MGAQVVAVLAQDRVREIKSRSLLTSLLKYGRASRRLHVRAVERRLQCALVRHCGHGFGDHLLLAPAPESDQELPLGAHHHRPGDGHRHIPLRAHLQFLGGRFRSEAGWPTYTVTLSGNPFNDAYRYVDWLLTVPLLLIELILVMKLPADETSRLSTNLGIASAVMVALGYPG